MLFFSFTSCEALSYLITISLTRSYEREKKLKLMSLPSVKCRFNHTLGRCIFVFLLQPINSRNLLKMAQSETIDPKQNYQCLKLHAGFPLVSKIINAISKGTVSFPLFFHSFIRKWVETMLKILTFIRYF